MSETTLEKKPILIAEDDEEFRTMLWRFLAPLYDVHQAANGKEAVALLQEKKPLLLLTDIIMPEMGGIELLHALRGELQSTIPAIVLFATGSPEDAVAARKLSSVTIVPKETITRESIRQIVADHLA